MANQVDALGNAFSPEEKKILRSRSEADKKERDRLVVKLADIFTFTRAPRGKQAKEFPIDCFTKAALSVRLSESSPFQLPDMTPDDLVKAELVMDYVSQELALKHAHARSGLTAIQLVDFLSGGRDEWSEERRDEGLASIVEQIPNRTQIKKVVCLGLSQIARRMSPPASPEILIHSDGVAQHVLVMAIVAHLRRLVSHEIEVFAADWRYDAVHATALKLVGFTAVLDGTSARQEHFVEIDDDTMVVAFASPFFELILPTISEYARPVAILCDKRDYMLQTPHARPGPSPVWSEVEYKDEWVAIPGPPPVTRTTSSECRLSEGTKMPGSDAFYTESTGRMLDSYRLAMCVTPHSGSGLANYYTCHPCTDDGPEYPGVMGIDRTGEQCCLLVRE